MAEKQSDKMSSSCLADCLTNNQTSRVDNASRELSMEDSGRESIVIVLAIVRLCLAVFGCIANTVSAVVLTNRKLWSPTSMLLLSLVVYDALYLLLVLPITAISISINVHYTAAKYSALMTITSLSFSLRFMTQMASTYTTVTVTIER